MTANKVKSVSSEIMIKYLEEDVMRIEQQIKDLQAAKAKKQSRQQLVDWQTVKARVRYLAEHLEELLLKQVDPVRKAQLFAALLINYRRLKT